MSCNGCPGCPQPYGSEISFDGVFLKEMVIPKAGTIVPQHAHEYSHVSYLARGTVIVEADGRETSMHAAPFAIEIPARVKHRFTSVYDDTLILCIHHDRGGAAVHEEHQIVGEV